MLLSYFLMILSLILLIINGLQGYFHFKIYSASHIQFAFIATILYMFSQSWIMCYFIGAGKTIKETILKYNLDKSLYQDVVNSKRKLFPHLTLNILLIGTVFVIGGGVQTKVISGSTHGGLFILSFLHLLYLIKLEHYEFKETADMLTKLGIMIEKKGK